MFVQEPWTAKASFDPYQHTKIRENVLADKEKKQVQSERVE
jgi:hypothetical protein